MIPHASRRHFLTTSLAGASYFAAAGSRRAWSQSPNERPQVACIGVGGKGSSDSDNAALFGDVIAICDVDRNTLASKGKSEKFKAAEQFTDYRELFAKFGKQIDLCTVSTPDHMHAPVTLEAMRLGIGCYTQKPLTRTIYEARLLARVAAEHGVATQMGNQGTALDSSREAIAQIETGVLGPLKAVYAWSNRPVWAQGPDRRMNLRNYQLQAMKEVNEQEDPTTTAAEVAEIVGDLVGEKEKEIARALERLDWNHWLGVAPEKIVQVGPYRYARLAIEGPEHRPFHVRIGMSTRFLDENIAALMRLLIPVGIILSLLTPLAGYWLAVRATRPVANILQTADRLRPTRLGDRLAVSGSKDELDRLSLTINRLLDEVAGHVERQERFVADAAHELRGPLAAMQSTLEVAVSQARSSAEYRDTLEDVLEAARHLSKITNDLLVLAESSEASAPRIHESVSLAKTASQATGMFAGVAEDRGICLELETAATPVIAGDSARIRQVIGNLLDNALRFTPRSGSVTVQVGEGPKGEGILVVSDTGPGIAPGDLERIFDRFFKADLARSHATGRRSGGLGLAICKSFVEASQGSITIVSNPQQGTRVTVRLPAWREPLSDPSAAPTVRVPAGSGE